jgi:RNA polymerase sigma factor (sigma-70 family)
VRRRLYSSITMQANTKRSQPVASDVRELYEQYASPLRSFLGQQLRVKHRVEDVLHDIFECLLRYPPAERLIRPDNYIWRIAWRLVNATNRRVTQDGERMATVAGEAGDWVLGQSSTLTPEDVSEWLAYEEQVRQGLERLTPEERKAVMMARLGYPYKEIAARMDISIESLRNYLRRGYLMLKMSVADSEQE